MEEALLGGLSPQAFLRRHWQKRPLLVRGALPGFGGAITKSALCALAARGDVESRLVEHRNGRWQVAHGPLARSRLPRATARNWTLLVNDVNHHNAQAEDLLRRFAFAPQARLDDVMVSYAARGGGVGPHFDSYDVFLVQGRGRRLWRLAKARPEPRPFSLVPDAPLKLIAGFRAEEEVVLEPGDLLYLPPGWGHDGIALEPCFTYSVGFRAPRGAELAAAFLDHLHERGLPDAVYRDPGLRPAARPALIGPELAAFAEAQLARIRWTRGDVEEFLGRYLSTPKANIVFSSNRNFSGKIRDRTVSLHPKTQMLYRGSRFFVNGEVLRPRRAQRQVLAVLADRRRAPGSLLAHAGLERLILEWHRAGFLLLESVP
ncbi:MAG: cupin domain-containing protein [Betaproteobacteria bacterium]|nr:cupin domain-containing protein [Betaproteobacteria bacterium]